SDLPLTASTAYCLLHTAYLSPRRHEGHKVTRRKAKNKGEMVRCSLAEVRKGIVANDEPYAKRINASISDQPLPYARLPNTPASFHLFFPFFFVYLRVLRAFVVSGKLAKG